MSEDKDLGDKLQAWAKAELEHDSKGWLELQREDALEAAAEFYGVPRASPTMTSSSSDEPEKPARRPPLDWDDLSNKTPPDRKWAIDHWLPMGCVTLLAGPGGIGKSLVAQAMGSCLALRREYLDFVDTERRVLFWACEDSQDELWRREVAIASWLGISLAELSGKFFTHGYDGCQVELAGMMDQKLIPSGMLSELHQQIGDYKADVLLLDNVARLYGGNENDRHQVTDFIAMLTAAAAPTGAAILLLGHPSKQAGSEYSGSTAWEAACRGRLYLGNKLPDAPKDPSGEEENPDDDVTYLCRRKANYSSKDWRKLKRINGVMVPEVPIAELSSRPNGHAADSPYMASVVTDAISKLNSMGMSSTASSASPSYLPKLAEQYKLLNGSSKQEFVKAMRALQSSGALTVGQVGLYPNRTKKYGLICTNEMHK